MTIVGVVGDEKQDGLDAPVREEVYETHLQNADSEMTLVIRCDADPSGFVPQVRRAVAEVDSTVAFLQHQDDAEPAERTPCPGSG